MSVAIFGNMLVIVVVVVMTSESYGSKTDNQTTPIKISTLTLQHDENKTVNQTTPVKQSTTTLSTQEGGRKTEVDNQLETILKSLDSILGFVKGLKYLLQEWLDVRKKSRHPLQSTLDLMELFEVPLPSDVSQQCQKHVQLFFRELLNTFMEQKNPLKEWSIQMLDAIFKPPPGIMRGTITWPGSFTECVNIVGKDSRDKNQKELFVGEHCFASVKLPETLMLKIEVQSMDMKLAMCFPSSCTIYDKNQLLNSVASHLKLNVSIKENMCHTKNVQQMDTTATIITVMLFIPIAVVLVATGMESYGNRRMDNGETFWQERQEQIGYRVLSAFSIANSWRILNSETQFSLSNFKFIQGMRCFTICWVLYGHFYISASNEGQWKEKLGAFEAFRNFFVSPLLHGFVFSFDTFFFLSGFSIVYFNLQKAKQNSPSVLKILLMYPLRYLRLTTSFAVMLAFVVGPWMYMGNGPFWSLVSGTALRCRSDWWKSLLYIGNFDAGVIDKTMRIPVWWYTSVEMQAFLIAPPLVYLFIRKPKWAELLAVPIYIGLVIIRGYNSVVYELTDFTMIEIDINNLPHKQIENEIYMYTDTINRASTFVLGLIFGHCMDIIVQTKIRLKSHIVAAGWILCVGMTSVIVYAEYPFNIGTIKSTHAIRVFWCAMSSSLWCLPLAWIVFACSTGHGGIATRFLSWQPFVALGHLSYSIYLVHLIVGISYAGMSQSFHNTDPVTMTAQAASFLVVSIAASLFLFMLVEAPNISIKWSGEKKKPLTGQDEYIRLLDEKTKTVLGGSPKLIRKNRLVKHQ